MLFTEAYLKRTLMEIVKQFREILSKRDNRIGREFNHVLSLKTDEEIVDKILSLSNAEMLKDLQRLVDGRGYNWLELLEDMLTLETAMKWAFICSLPAGCMKHFDSLVPQVFRVTWMQFTLVLQTISDCMSGEVRF